MIKLRVLPTRNGGIIRRFVFGALYGQEKSMIFVSDAMAEAPQAQSGGGVEMMVMIGIFFAIMYFMIIRPQQKRQKEHKSLMESLSKGDEVVTNGGMMGRIKGVSDDVVRIELTENVVIKVQKQAINSVLPKGTLNQD